MKKKCMRIILSAFVLIICASCRTVDLEALANSYEQESVASSRDEEIAENESTMHEYLVQEELKVQDQNDIIIYVEKPVYVPEQRDVPELERKEVTGYDAAIESQKVATIKPENYKNGTFYYQYDENLVYEIYAQPYHLTDIILEAGEAVIATPLLSEDEAVWELTAGVAKDTLTGLDVQHLFIKPAYSKLDSSLIIITDRRVYHLRIKSYSDTHMAMVKFTYPTIRNQWVKSSANSQPTTLESSFVRTTNPENISVDYKIKYSIFKTPEFLPKMVYDDGQITYILVDESVLQKKLPLLFNERNEIVNYTVQGNLFVIPRLINKMTLRLGNESVTIEKKKSKAESEE